MKISEILDYIKAYLELGYTKKQVVDLLTKKGVSLSEIELCFKQLGVYSVEDLASLEYLFNNLLIALIDKGWKDVTKNMVPLHEITNWDFIGFREYRGKEWYVIFKRTGEFNEKDINNVAIAFSLVAKKLSSPRTNFILFFITEGVSYMALKRFYSLENVLNYRDPLHGIGRTYLIDMNVRKCHGKEFVSPPKEGEFAAQLKYTVEAELRLDVDLFEREEFAKRRKKIAMLHVFLFLITLIGILVGMLFLFREIII